MCVCVCVCLCVCVCRLVFEPVKVCCSGMSSAERSKVKHLVKKLGKLEVSGSVR